MTPQVTLIRTAGTNCDAELRHAFELCGAQVTVPHLSELLTEPAQLDAADIIALPGGFSYGDDIAAGRVFAHRLKLGLLPTLQSAVTRGTPILGICNGFQVLVKLGLLPDPAPATQTTTLAFNNHGRFTAKWVPVEVPENTACVWTQGLAIEGEFELPIAHAEGRFTAPDTVLDQLETNGQIALRYTQSGNPNGSARDIAGICDPSGLVFGLMPHPERFTDPGHHPAPQARPAMAGGDAPKLKPIGLRIIEQAVDHIRRDAPTPA